MHPNIDPVHSRAIQDSIGVFVRCQSTSHHSSRLRRSVFGCSIAHMLNSLRQFLLHFPYNMRQMSSDYSGNAYEHSRGLAYDYNYDPSNRDSPSKARKLDPYSDDYSWSTHDSTIAKSPRYTKLLSQVLPSRRHSVFFIN